MIMRAYICDALYTEFGFYRRRQSPVAWPLVWLDVSNTTQQAPPMTNNVDGILNLFFDAKEIG